MTTRRAALLGAGLGTLGALTTKGGPAMGSTPNTHLRATVQAPGSSGDPFSVLVDGADTEITVNGKPGYAPVAGDRVMISRLGTQIQMVGKLAGTDIITAGVFETDDNVGLASAGGVQGMILSGDTAGGVIQGYTGALAETAPAFFNPMKIGALPVLRVGSPAQGSNQASLTLSPFGGSVVALVPGGLFEFENVDLECTGNITADVNVIGQIFQTLSPPTSTNAANARIGASGLINIVTSRSRQKLRQRPLGKTTAYSVLKATPTTWHDRNDTVRARVAGKPIESVPRTTGFIAENVQKVAPDFAEYDETGELVGVDYRAMAVALTGVVADLNDRIEALETKLAHPARGNGAW